jgi:hypothetical protein
LGLATWCADPNLTGLRHPGGDTSGFAFFNPFTGAGGRVCPGWWHPRRETPVLALTA